MKQRVSLHVIKLVLPFIMMGFVVSCNDIDEFYGYNNTTELCFSAKVADNWQGANRSGSTRNAQYSCHQLDSSGLWLHTIVEETPDSCVLYSSNEMTRASEKTSIDTDEIMGVYAYVTKDGNSSEFMKNQSVTNTAQSGWAYSPIKYWPGPGYTLDFYAYLPYADEDNKLGTSVGADNSPCISYTVPANNPEQLDLLAATKTYNTNTTSAGSVEFQFQHILTAIKFKCAEGIQKGEITRVALKGVNSKGTYNLKNNSWEANTPADYTLDTEIQAKPEQAITSDEQIFMMIPQELPDDATIEIGFTYATNTGEIRRTLSKPIKDITPKWTTGSTITYMISNSPLDWEYTLDVKVDANPTTELNVGYGGAFKKFEITSSRIKDGGAVEAVKWQTLFSTDGGNNWKNFEDIGSECSWLSNITTSGTAITTNCEAEVLPQPLESNDLNVKMLQETPKIGTSNEYSDLSKGGETANCYIINAAGYYKLPLIYGNARNADGSANTQSYAPTGCPEFKDYKDEAISKPEIDIPVGSDATLVWQDAPGVIKDVKLDAESKFLQFQVDKDFIRPCNAIVAVRDNNDVIMWSWHIWVTPYQLGEGDGTVTVGDNSYTFMAVNLGWCNEISQSSYGKDKRSIKIKIIQDEGLEKIITLTQGYKEDYEIKRGESPYYQWGRKDPSPSVNGNRTFVGTQGAVQYYHDKETFGPYTFGVTPDKNAKSLGYSIQNPHLFIDFPTSGDNKFSWCEEDKTRRNNYWNATRGQGLEWTAEAKYTEENTKSVYDPCPVGYKVPIHNALRGIADGDFETSSALQNNNIEYVGVSPGENDGDYFYINEMSTTASTFYDVKKWYLLGMRMSGGKLREVTNDESPKRSGQQGYYHSSSGFYDISDKYNRCLHLYLRDNNNPRIATYIAYYRGEGHNIRPVRDYTSGQGIGKVVNGGSY